MMLTGLAPSGGSVSGSAALASCSHEIAPSGGGATEAVEPSDGATTSTLVPLGTLAAISGHRSACTTSAFALLSPSTWAISSLRQCQLMGTALAASGAVATDASMNSIELRNRSAMRSPAPTSSSSRPRLARKARSNSSGYVMKRAPQRTPISSSSGTGGMLVASARRVRRAANGPAARDRAGRRRGERRTNRLQPMKHVALRDHDGGVVVLSADRPPANAMDVGLLGELVEAVERLAHEVPRALVLAGRPGFFSAGADLKAVPGYGPEQQRAMITGINRMALGVYDLPCPVVGAITGHAIAGGVWLDQVSAVCVAARGGR